MCVQYLRKDIKIKKKIKRKRWGRGKEINRKKDLNLCEKKKKWLEINEVNQICLENVRNIFLSIWKSLKAR